MNSSLVSALNGATFYSPEKPSPAVAFMKDMESKTEYMAEFRKRMAVIQKIQDELSEKMRELTEWQKEQDTNRRNISQK